MQLQQLTLATVLLAVASAQDSGSGSTPTGPPTIKFNDTDLTNLNTSGKTGFVTLTERNSWCTGQRTACTTLCGGSFASNQCDGNALTWDCTCASNNSAPGLGYYTTTMPNQICNKLNGLCMAAQAMNGVEAQQQCNQTYVCGDLNITAFNSGGSGDGGSASASASGTGASASETPSATGSGSGTATSSQAAAAALHVSEHYGAAMLSGALVAALGFLL